MKRPNDKSAPPNALYNWYPGHMAKALREIKQKLNMVDIVLEIRDARVPLVSGNSDMNNGLGEKPKLIVLNKVNLATPEIVAEWEKWFQHMDIPHIFINCLDKASTKRAISAARKIIEKNRKISNPEYVEGNSKLKLMIVGLPNTGKSSLINQLVSKNAAKVADKPGLTQIQQWIRVENDIELLDTPGVMPPKIELEEHGLWLSAIHAIPDHIAGEEDIAIYVIKFLMKIESPQFAERYRLESFKLTPDEVLLKIATLRGCLRQKGLPDLERVYKLILAEFRKGDLGQCSFESPPIGR